MMTRVSGFGININRQNIWPSSAERMWKLIDLSPSCAKDLAELRDELDPNSEYAVTDLMESIDCDHSDFGLAQILAQAINEHEDIKVEAVMDFYDSDNVLVAYKLAPGELHHSHEPKWEDTRKKLTAIFRKYVGIITDDIIYPTYEDWCVHVEPKREFVVDTPIGKIKVYAKGEDDSKEDYPGVWVDFVSESGEECTLACVEYSPSDVSLYTDVYYDGAEQETIERTRHKNLPGCALEEAKALIQCFCRSAYQEDADLSDLSCIHLASTSVENTNEELTVQVNIDLLKCCVRTYVHPDGDFGNHACVRVDSFQSLEDLSGNFLCGLSFDDITSLDEEDWTRFGESKMGREWLRQKYPAGTKIRLTYMDDIQAPPCGAIGTVHHVDDGGQIHMNWETGGSLALHFGTDGFKIVGSKEAEA